MSYFKGKYQNGAQNYLVFQPIHRYFKRVAGVASGSHIYFWKSNQRINSITTSNYSITPELDYYGSKIRVKFSGSCLKPQYLTKYLRLTLVFM